MKLKTNAVLVIVVVVLLFVLGGEIFYLFFYKPKQNSVVTTVTNTTNQNINGMVGVYEKTSDTEMKYIYDSLSKEIEATKEPVKNGVLKQILLTETYRTVLTEVKTVSIVKKMFDGSEGKFDVSLRFSNMSDGSKKDMGYLFTKDEMSKITVFQAVGSEEVPMPFEKLKAGDFVSITVVTDMLASPKFGGSLISIKIVKLL